MMGILELKQPSLKIIEVGPWHNVISGQAVCVSHMLLKARFKRTDREVRDL